MSSASFSDHAHAFREAEQRAGRAFGIDVPGYGAIRLSEADEIQDAALIELESRADAAGDFLVEKREFGGAPNDEAAPSADLATGRLGKNLTNACSLS